MVDTKKEIWKDIHNFSKYEINNYGNVRNKKTQKVLKTFRIGGYFRICITNDTGVRKGCRINRLVALTFLANPENKPTVNHKNHNSLDNSLSNLE